MKHYPAIKVAAGKLDTSNFKGEVAFEVVGLIEKGGEEKPVIEWNCAFFWSSDASQEGHYGKSFTIPFFFFGDNLHITIGQLKKLLKEGGFNVGAWEEAENAEVMIPGALNYLAINHAIILGKCKPSGGKNFFNLIKLLRVDPNTGAAFPGYAIPEVIDDKDVLAAFNVDTSAESKKTPF